MNTRNSVPSRRSSQCKGPEAGACLVCLRNNKDAGVTGGRRREEEGEFRRKLEKEQVEGQGRLLPGLEAL